MKITPIKIAAVAIVLTTLSFASCRSAGYGCDYGSTELLQEGNESTELCIETGSDDTEVKTSYRKISRP